MPGDPRLAGPGRTARAHHPLRRLRRRRGMTLAALAGLTGVSVSYISMVERGERSLTRLDYINAMAAALRVSPADIAPDAIAVHPDLRAAGPSSAPAFPAAPSEVTMTRHAGLAREFLAYAARGDTRAAGMWLRRIARDPAVSPWLLLDLLAAHYARTPGPRLPASTANPTATYYGLVAFLVTFWTFCPRPIRNQWGWATARRRYVRAQSVTSGAGRPRGGAMSAPNP